MIYGSNDDSMKEVYLMKFQFNEIAKEKYLRFYNKLNQIDHEFEKFKQYQF